MVSINKKCTVCDRDTDHLQVIEAGLILWKCVYCKTVSAFRLIGEIRFADKKDNPDDQMPTQSESAS